MDGGVQRDAEPGSDSGLDAGHAELYGNVVLYHHHDLSSYGGILLVLSAAFYTEPYTPPEVSGHTLMETRSTSNGVECDIYYQSGMDPDPPPPEPDPPAQDDGGDNARAGGG